MLYRPMPTTGSPEQQMSRQTVTHFDYADIIWDSCTETQSNLLENMHLEAIRIIIGAVKGTNHQKIVRGIRVLFSKRKKKKKKT